MNIEEIQKKYLGDSRQLSSGKMDELVGKKAEFDKLVAGIENIVKNMGGAMMKHLNSLNGAPSESEIAALRKLYGKLTSAYLEGNSIR